MKRPKITERMKIACLLWLAEGATKIEGSMFGTYTVPAIYCPECDQPILATDVIEWDHRHALVHDGPHHHTNIRPIHYDCHKKKTARDIKANAKVKRIAAGGRKRKGRKMPSRPFPKRGKPHA